MCPASCRTRQISLSRFCHVAPPIPIDGVFLLPSRKMKQTFAKAALLVSAGVCNFSCPGQVYRWGGAIRPSSFLRLGHPQSGQKGRSLSAIARVVKHSWNCARPKASADRPEQMPRKVLAQPERLPIACGLGDAKRSACSPPSHAAASAGVTGAEPLSRGWQSVQAFHLG